jgi:hypothetical protein
MPSADRVMFAQRPASPDSAQHVRFKLRSLTPKKVFGHRKDPLALLARQHFDAVVSAFRDQEKRKLEGWAPYRLLRSLMT